MGYQNKLKECLNAIVGSKLDALLLACEMMCFQFEGYTLHAQCLTRIICEEDILVTTLDYQNWDGEVDTNNDEWYYVEKYKDRIVGGIVQTVNVSSLYDVVIVLDNGIEIQLINKNGYAHFDEECEQWRFFNGDGPHTVVYAKTVDLGEE